MPTPGASWPRSDFAKLWAGQTVSVFGSLLTRTALPFTAILVLEASPFQMGLLGAADLVPGLLLGLFAGALVDRVRRRPLMIAADLVRAALLISIPVAAMAGALGMIHLCLVAFLAGACTLLFDVAYLSYLPALVPKERLVSANSRLAASASVAEVAAFGGGGWLVQLLTPPVAIAIDAITFLVSAVTLGTIRTPEIVPGPRLGPTPLGRELSEGFGALRRDPVLARVAFATVTYEFSLGIGGAVYMLFVSRTLGFTPGVLGLIFAVGGVSSLFGAWIAGRGDNAPGSPRAMALGLALSGAASLLAPLAQDARALGLGLLVAQQAIGDGGAVVFMINQIAVRQALTPEHLMGRVNGTVRFLGVTAMVIGSVGGGALGQVVGLKAVLILGAVARLLAVAWVAGLRTEGPEVGP